jgi:signal transduction histidine kinase/FixJ family two-component response regulator
MGLLIGDTFYFLNYNFPDQNNIFFTISEFSFTIYVTFIFLYLWKNFKLIIKKELLYITLILLFNIFISWHFVVSPYINSGNYASTFFYLNSIFYRLLEAMVLSISVILSIRTYSNYWLYILHGLFLLSISSIALGYNSGVLVDKYVPFHEYGWLLGLLFILLGQIFDDENNLSIAKWKSVRVQLVWIIFVSNCLFTILLHLFGLFSLKDTFQFTFLLFSIYGLWFISNTMSFYIFKNVKNIFDNIEKQSNLLIDNTKIKLPFSELQEFAEKLHLAYKTIETQNKLIAISDLSAQVAHDIRSPLAALDSSLNDISQLPEEKRIIIRNAINRIRDIANNLLEKYRYNSKEKFDFDNNQTKNLKTCLISTLIDQVITEKRLQYKTKPEINIDFELTNDSYGLFSNIDPVEFKRIISNLVNNSVEAMPYDKGNIKVILSSEDEYVIVKVKDDGRGIPPEILSRLGEKGLTFNKKGGSGLGLYHSKTTIEKWSGKLEINSELNKGTEIIIKIPKAKTPDWFCESININSKTKIIVVDDDETIHNIWQDRFKKYNIEIIHLYNPNDLKHYMETEKELYLIDYEFKGYNESGLDLIKELNISDKSILVTSHFENEIIIERCRKLNIKLIPKTLSGFVPIIFTDDENKVKEVVLIDDDELVLMNWQISAKKKGIKLIKYKNSKDFYKDIDKIDKETPIYIDSELEEGQKGEDIAKDLREKGFKKIILETGYSPERFKDISWLKIVGKEPPF